MALNINNGTSSSSHDSPRSEVTLPRRAASGKQSHKIGENHMMPLPAAINSLGRPSQIGYVNQVDAGG